MSMKPVFTALLTGLLLTACRHPNSPGTKQAPKAERQHYGMPAVPPSLKEPQERADFVVEHYWERYDFKRKYKPEDSTFLEQAFVDYAAVLPLADSICAGKSIAKLVAASADACYRERLMSLAKHYLGHPQSPVRNEMVYTMFLRRYAALPSLTPEQRERALYMSHQLSKNLPGRQAADFAYTTRKGRKGTLHTTKGRRLLLVFYDPDCENCHRILAEMMQAEWLTGHPDLRVMAVYAGEDAESWRKERMHLPEGWMDAHAPEIERKQLYYIPATPAFYLLDEDKKVVLKDATPEQLQDVMMQ